MAGSYDDRDGAIWLDGQMVDWRSANVHVLTHSLHYGGAVFEGERAYGGTIYASERHSGRLLHSGDLLGFEIPWTIDEIERAKHDVLQENSLSDAYVRAIAWRGSGEEMGVSCSRNKVRLAIAAWEWGAYYGDRRFQGARLDISRWRRPSPDTIPAKAKASGLYMICTMSKHAAEAKGLDDSLMLDYRGYIAEATGANIFFVRDGEVHTPLPDCFLDGITRQTVIRLLYERQIKVHERHIGTDELAGFEQCWLTGTAAEVTPVSQIGTHRYEVGEMTIEMARDYEQRVRGQTA